ncbi:MAG: hypothetical protein ACYTCU_08575 [Planctomycetota bacterium]|jgi:hypothetical protein
MTSSDELDEPRPEGRDSERDALRRLLDAVDHGTPGLPELLALRPRDGALFGLLARHELADADLRLLLVALAARLSGRVALSGGELVRQASPDSAERLALLARLTTSGRLVRGGLLLPETLPHDGPAAEAETYRLGEIVFRLACDLFALPQPVAAGGAALTGPYRTNLEVLSDLRRLSVLYRRRAARLFHLDPWSGTGLEPQDGAGELVARARSEAGRITQRLAESAATDTMPLLRMREKHKLDLDALVILVTMLFQELVEGVGAVDAVDLVKLVSESEGDLIKRRQLLRPLHRARLLRFEGAYAGKDLTADACLPNDVVDAMLGTAAVIGTDEQIDFHAYIQQLDSSDPFFTDLDGTGSLDD